MRWKNLQRSSGTKSHANAISYKTRSASFIPLISCNASEFFMNFKLLNLDANTTKAWIINNPTLALTDEFHYAAISSFLPLPPPSLNTGGNALLFLTFTLLRRILTGEKPLPTMHGPIIFYSRSVDEITLTRQIPFHNLSLYNQNPSENTASNRLVRADTPRPLWEKKKKKGKRRKEKRNNHNAAR